MAEEETQENSQPVSQPSGGGEEFVSLVQARRIALAHARENRDLYARRYARQDLIWEVVNREELTENYLSRLSYRPARGFLGRAGLEEFTIDRQGSILSRRIISRPVRRRKIPGCGLLTVSVSLLLLVLALGVLASAI